MGECGITLGSKRLHALDDFKPTFEWNIFFHCKLSLSQGTMAVTGTLTCPRRACRKERWRHLRRACRRERWRHLRRACRRERGWIWFCALSWLRLRGLCLLRLCILQIQLARLRSCRAQKILWLHFCPHQVTQQSTETEVSQLFAQYHWQRRFNNVLFENVIVIVPHFRTILGGIGKANKNIKRGDGDV